MYRLYGKLSLWQWWYGVEAHNVSCQCLVSLWLLSVHACMQPINLHVWFSQCLSHMNDQGAQTPIHVRSKVDTHTPKPWQFFLFYACMVRVFIKGSFGKNKEASYCEVRNILTPSFISSPWLHTPSQTKMQLLYKMHMKITLTPFVLHVWLQKWSW